MADRKSLNNKLSKTFPLLTHFLIAFRHPVGGDSLVKRSGMFSYLTRVQISLRVSLILVISTFWGCTQKIKIKGEILSL